MLRQHVVVTLPGGRGQVVGVPRADTAKVAVAVTTASTSAHLEAIDGSAGRQTLQATRRGVEVGKQVAARVDLLGAGASLGGSDLADVLAHLLLVGLVQLHHAATGKVQGVGGCEEGEQTNLHRRVVDDLVLTGLVLRVAVLELATHGSVARGNGDTAGEDRARLQHNGGADPGKSTVDERGRGRTHVLGRLWVDAGEASQHADMRHLDLVEEQEAVVHGVVAKLGANVANVDVVERLVRLEIADLHDKGVGPVRLALEDQLRHDDGVVCGAAEGANPPLGRCQMGRVDGKRLVVLVPRRRRLESSHVGPVAELRLCVAANVLVVLRFLEELFVLLGVALVAEGDLIDERVSRGSSTLQSSIR